MRESGMAPKKPVHNSDTFLSLRPETKLTSDDRDLAVAVYDLTLDSCGKTGEKIRWALAVSSLLLCPVVAVYLLNNIVKQHEFSTYALQYFRSV
jgi:hypothetical protein